MSMGTNTTTRRAVLAGAASLPALAMPAAAAPASDPVFAAIAVYADARRALQKSMAEFPGADIDRDLCDDEQYAVESLLLTMPTTMHGAAAQLRTLAAFAAMNDCQFLGQFGGLDEGCDDFLPKLAGVIESLSAGRVQS